MSNEARVVQNYILKSPENFLLSCAVAKEVEAIKIGQRIRVWKAIEQKCRTEFIGYEIKVTLSAKSLAFISIYKKAWQEGGFFITVYAEAQYSNLRGWMFGLRKPSTDKPYMNDIRKLPQESVVSYLSIRNAAFGGNSNSNVWWLAYQNYPDKYQSLEDYEIATLLTEDGFEIVIKALFEPIKELIETVEPTIERELQNLK